ncbi:conserved hypothetical protein [Lodderomyces elongisporus NRRL YB-4239]|uniref:HIT-type domain-containing protein n=1 Tax=Lodderomyces elongisporus (strain ATCC 11503 / CBS 2605 / JCM 1781 / NBRC 1676 / NRRL YB-4239) TaxID=379508 RepID=A5DYK2_LODEL|nr:conserved hypothetical protein [Lodderomyces elongisporus NRRL YB-4239]
MEESLELCLICLSNRAKYTCPACAYKTCSLFCYKTHQREQSCTGKVDVTRFVTRDELSQTPVHLNRDYNYLQNVDRKISLSKEDIKSNARNILKRSRNEVMQDRRQKRVKRNDGGVNGGIGGNVNNFNGSNSGNNGKNSDNGEDRRRITMLEVFPQNPSIVIKRQNTMVVQLPLGMQRAVSNKTGYDKKLNTFVWTVEWILLDNDQGKQLDSYTSFRLKESGVLKEIVPQVLLSRNGFDALPFSSCPGSSADADADARSPQLYFFLRNVANKPINSLIQLSSNAILSDALKDKIVLEYPTIYITTNVKSVQNRIVSEIQGYGLRGDSDQSSSDSDSDTGSEVSSSSGTGSDSDSDSELDSDADADADADSDTDSRDASESEDSGPEEASLKKLEIEVGDDFEEQKYDNIEKKDLVTSLVEVGDVCTVGDVAGESSLDYLNGVD